MQVIRVGVVDFFTQNEAQNGGAVDEKYRYFALIGKIALSCSKSKATARGL